MNDVSKNLAPPRVGPCHSLLYSPPLPPQKCTFGHIFFLTGHKWSLTCWAEIYGEHCMHINQILFESKWVVSFQLMVLSCFLIPLTEVIRPLWLWRWLPRRLLKPRSMSTTVLFTYLWKDYWFQTFHSYVMCPWLRLTTLILCFI